MWKFFINLYFLLEISCNDVTTSYRTSTISTPHGSFYGFQEIDPQSYIYRNHYRTTASGPSSFLTNVIFYGHDIRFGITMHDIETYIPWNEAKDEEWRATTKAPYFENKIPQSQEILSAAAVDGKINYS